MLNLFKRKKKYPDFASLEKYEKKDCYFIRIARWNWISNNNIMVRDPDMPRIITLDPWPEWIFIAANGQMTIKEYVFYMAGKYKGEIPGLLDHQIINEIATLIQLGIIKIVDEKQRPDSAFELPDNESE